ncbi:MULTISPECIES: P1 family peptidase [unclassified Rhizobium]|jgi:D-aminopeptidase|uniref:DmpA family aminopeptidase n=1 Tax=unclassified Rhizobium TaxID=2613769 RepID=UPI000649276C|nr:MULTISPECIES: P1 family peptidase [unclassified Rhizobium]MBN8954738.1 P1 family peptidase [Rhizobium tropici]OJY73415.1 MAG: aminopeptidase [Rhizobium sp. 60-20]RKD72404.1 L-aminopeptidase/D-esterase-like protein [Rhizobium sp. WW_1]
MTMKTSTRKPRGRQFGLPFTGRTGANNAITDVAGIGVGFRTIIENEPRPGRKRPTRTGVTAILPHMDSETPVPVYAGVHRFNGNGEMTGTHWIEDGGYFLGPVVITNTHGVGMAHHATVKWMIDRYASTYQTDDFLWIMPVIAETYDGALNDINGLHISETDVRAALDSIAAGPVQEGNCGGGTGMITYGFKGGTGTSSRIVQFDGRTYTIGTLVQANHGQRDWLTIAGVPVGQHMRDGTPQSQLKERGSIIVVIATDLPLAPHQLKRLARRAAIGIGRNGTPGGNNSGDIFLAFSTANAHPMAHRANGHLPLEIVNDEPLDPVYMAAVDSVEEAVVNAMLAAEDMGGTPYDRLRIQAIPHEQLAELIRQYGRMGA